MEGFRYLTPQILAGFDKYKYSSVDTSPVSKYITHPFWNWVVELYPKWLAPNLLTLIGFMQLIMNVCLMTYYDPHFYAASRDHPEYPPVPNWVWLVCAINNFLSHTLDGTDGKQARRTNSSSPLGELFDHGLDSWASMFMPVAIYSIFGRGEFGVGVYRTFFVLLGLNFCFILSHWEKYNTCVLFLPWGYDIGLLSMTVVYFITSIGGTDMWKFKVPVLDYPVSEVIEIIMHCKLYFSIGVFGLTCPPVIWNIYKSYRDKTGNMLSPWEAIRPLVSTMILFTLMISWAALSSNDVIELQPRLFYWTTGTAFSNITPSATVELCLLWGYCILATVAHLHFGFCVVKEMCEHFNINALTIKKKEE
ncbi:hypothetical protein KUTeg_016572 [Tegillarca granosa]|uniref:Ethanolaminephosphotransferase 1 n=1 Tax=Tegillarca granosa TaxID=220873 RepID=A0ABQ9ER21_TEGGR|nr:hypothetical protein KUTeg_016572 [Tegillarca granosa]